MNARTVVWTPEACKIGGVNAGLHGLMSPRGGTVAVRLSTSGPTGLTSVLHGSTQELRVFAKALLQCCNETDAAAPGVAA